MTWIYINLLVNFECLRLIKPFFVWVKTISFEICHISHLFQRKLLPNTNWLRVFSSNWKCPNYLRSWMKNDAEQIPSHGIWEELGLQGWSQERILCFVTLRGANYANRVHWKTISLQHSTRLIIRFLIF